MVVVYGVSRHFQKYFSYIVAVSFIGEEVLGENHRLYHIMLYRVQLDMNGVRTPNVTGDRH